MEYILSLLWGFLELLSFFLFNKAFLTQKRGGKISTIVFICTWLLMCGYSNTDIDPMLKQIVSVGVWVAFSFILYDGSWPSRIALAIVAYIFHAITDTAMIYGTCALLHIRMSEFVWRKLFYSTVVTIGKLLDVFLAWVLVRLRHSNGLRGIRNRWFLLMLLFPAVSMIVLVTVFFDYQNSEDLPWKAVLLSAILGIANVGVLYLIHALEKAAMRDRESALLKQQMTLQAENFASLEKNYRAQRKATHEFERHIQALQDLLKSGEYQTAEEYLQQLAHNQTLRLFRVHANHPVVDVILNQKYQEAQEKEIRMHLQVNDLSQMKIQTDLLVVLLSNLLDNAIEACQKIPQPREIDCSILLDDCVYLSVRNTSPVVTVQNGKIATSKAEKMDHGYGIPAIRYVLDHLGAEYTFAYQDGWFQAVAEIPLEEKE